MHMTTEYDKESIYHATELQWIVADFLFFEHVLFYTGWVRQNLVHNPTYIHETKEETWRDILENVRQNATLESGQSVQAIDKCWKCPFFGLPHNSLAGFPKKKGNLNYSIRTYANVNWKTVCNHLCAAQLPTGLAIFS